MLGMKLLGTALMLPLLQVVRMLFQLHLRDLVHFSSLFIFLFSLAEATSFSGKRYNSTSVILEWVISPGTTRYTLTQADSDGSIINSFVFPVNSSFIVPNLSAGVPFLFTLYSGNSFGFDTSQGPSALVSTLSNSLPFSLSFSFFFPQLSLDIALLCSSVYANNTSWSTTTVFQTACEFATIFSCFLFVKQGDTD